MIYMDTAATAKYRSVDDIIIDTMTTAMQDSWLNPSSIYASNIRGKVNKCRANIAKFIGANTEEIYFTSGASEANNMAIRGWIDNNKMVTNIITTPIEHKSIMNLIQSDTLNACVNYCAVDEYGLVDIKYLEELLAYWYGRPTLVTIQMANNEIGTVQNIKKISKIVHKYDGVLHVDATQALPYIPIDVVDLGIDMMSCSGHKLSPVLRGIGFLYKKNCINIQPLIYGAQEDGVRGGTENTYGIIGLNKAIEYCDVSDERFENICEKADYFIAKLKSKFGCKLNGHDTFRLPNNINVTFPQNITGESLLYVLDMSGIKCSVGSACNSESIEPSYVLKAIGLSDEDAMRSIRFTLSDDITYDDIDCVINEIGKAIKIIETS